MRFNKCLWPVCNQNWPFSIFTLSAARESYELLAQECIDKQRGYLS